MIHLQKHIRDVLQEYLDDNSQDLLFDVSLYDMSVESDLEKDIEQENTYLIDKKKYIPVVIQDILGNYVPLPNTTVIEGNIVASLMIPTTKNNLNNMAIEETFENVSLSIEEFRKATSGISLPLGELGYQLSDDYILSFSNTTPEVIDNISITVRFTEYLNESILNNPFDSGGLSLSRQGGNIVVGLFTSPSTQTLYSFAYELDKDYYISITREQLEGNNHEYTVIVNDEDPATFQNATILPSSGDGENYRITSSTAIIKHVSLNDVIVTDFTTNGTFEDWTWVTTNENNIVEVGDYGVITFEFRIPNPTSSQFVYGGINYQEYVLELGMVISKDVFMGNQVKYYLDGTQIFPIVRESGLGTETELDQKVNEFIAKGVVTDQSIGKAFSLYYKPQKKVVDLMKKITSISSVQNEHFVLVEQYPLFRREYNVLISEGGLTPSLLSPFIFGITLIIADDILL